MLDTNIQHKLWKDLMTDYEKNLKPKVKPQQQLSVQLLPNVYNIENLVT